MKKFFTIFILAIIALVSWISIRDYLRYHPAKNSQPKYFLTVKGHVDPAIQKSLKLTWVSDYYTTNPICNEYGDFGDWLEGASAERHIHRLFDVKPNQAGKYSIQIPIDYYNPGFCGWAPGEVYFSFKYKEFDYSADADTAFGLDKNGRVNHQTLKQKWHCGDTKCTISTNSDFDLSYNLSSLSNHSLVVNFSKISKDK